MKLWQKGDYKQDKLSAAVERFTIGSDHIWDIRLAKFDVQGSLAHAEMLQQVGILSVREGKAIKKGLQEILQAIESGLFLIEEGVEDVHSQVEKTLTLKTGEAGKKIHTGRSRNDQVLLDIKLLLKYEIREIAQLVLELFSLLQELSGKYKGDFLPGYTHFQLAMPSSFGLWFGAYAESLVDDMELLAAAFKIADKNPLGTGAGYGSAFPLDRKLSTGLMKFGGLNYNSVYAQSTRGKTEKSALYAFSSVASTLSKFAYDICLYMNQQFAFISFPDSLTTGSSIMPHKKNPDVFELIRAKCNRIQASPNEMTLLCANLPSGYHRDMQLTKEILFPAVDTMKECLSMFALAIPHIKVRQNILDDKKYDELFTVDEINKLVLSGISFRDAYKRVGGQVNEKSFRPGKKPLHTHIGSINNLCNKEIKAEMKKVCRHIPGLTLT